ncbi:MAG: hypothetical protein ACXVP0_15155 [Bacteroidia bacterium]
MRAAVKRPKVISAICIVGFIMIIFTFLMVFSPSVKKLGAFIPALYGFLVAGSFISYIGLWHMKQWGVQLFLLVFFVKTLFLIFINDLGPVSITGIVSSVVFAVVLLKNYPKMDGNL